MRIRIVQRKFEKTKAFLQLAAKAHSGLSEPRCTATRISGSENAKSRPGPLAAERAHGPTEGNDVEKPERECAPVLLTDLFGVLSYPRVYNFAGNFMAFNSVVGTNIFDLLADRMCDQFPTTITRFAVCETFKHILVFDCL